MITVSQVRWSHVFTALRLTLRVAARLALYFLATVGGMICAAVWLADLGDLGLPTYAFLHGVVTSAPMVSVFFISMFVAARGGPEWLWRR